MADFDISPDAVAKARSSGYSDDEIVQHLAPKAPDKFGAAAKAGYSSKEILDHLASPPQQIDIGASAGVMTGMPSPISSHQAVPLEMAKGVPVLGAAVPDTEGTKQFEKEQPGTAAGVRGIGGALALAPAMAIAPEAFGLGAGALLPNAVGGAATMGALGAADAAARGEPIVQGGLTGAAGGAVAPVAGKYVIGPAFKAIEKFLTPKATGALEGINPQALEWASKAAKQAGLTDQAVADKVNELGPHGFVAEFAPELMGVAREVAGGAGTGKNAMVKKFEERVAPTVVEKRTTEGLDKLMGKPTNLVQKNIEELEERKNVTDPLFKQWKTEKIQPTPEIKSVVEGLEEHGLLKRAEELAKIRSLETGQEVSPMRDFFTTGERKGWPTAESYGFLRRAINEKIQSAFDANNHDLGIAWKGVRARLDKTIGDSNQPAAQVWKQARTEWGSRGEVMKAREAGTKVWDTKYSKDQLIQDLTDMNPAERAAHKEGARAALEEISNRPSGDQSARRMLTGKGAQDKLRMIAENKSVSPEDVNTFITQVEREPAMAKAQKELGTSTQKLVSARMKEMMAPKETLPERFAKRTEFAPGHVVISPYIPMLKGLTSFSQRRQAAAYEKARDALSSLLTKQGPQAQEVVRALLRYQAPNTTGAARTGMVTSGIVNALQRPAGPQVPVPFLPPQWGGTP